MLGLALLCGILPGPNPARADTLCSEGPCNLAIVFDSGGSLEAPGGATLTFGQSPVLVLGLDGRIEPGEHADISALDDPAGLEAKQLVLGRGGAIRFGAGGALTLGSGGNIEYPAGSGLTLSNPQTLALSGSASQAQLGNLYSAGSVTLSNGADLALTGTAATLGMDVVALDPGNLIVLGTNQIEISPGSALASLEPAGAESGCPAVPDPGPSTAPTVDPIAPCAPSIQVTGPTTIDLTADLTLAGPSNEDDGGAASLGPGAVLLATLVALRRRRHTT